MIKEIILDNQPIKYQITFKNNKNTYFRFKRDGYIQINASRHQTHHQIFKYMRDNKKTFIEKYQQISKNELDEKSHQIFGVKYTKVTDKSVNNLLVNTNKKVIIEPDLPVDQLNILYKKMEKERMLEALENLRDKYLNNGIIDLQEVTFKTRYMETRFGSCNPENKQINFNLYLVRYAKKYLEYVFLHEITHLIHQNHSKDFYDLLIKFSNNYKQLKKELNSQFNYR